MIERPVKGLRMALEGDNAVAEAMRQINPDVVAAYPITPQTEIVMTFSEFVSQGRVDTEFIPVESEHAALSACIGAALAGARTQTATCGPGLALMWEMLWVASGWRLPIVMHITNRAFNTPLNILCSHDDSMGARDACWVQLYAETQQEAYDNVLQAVRIAEHPDVLLPVMCCLDGFVLSHTLTPVEILPDETVRDWIGRYRPLFSVLDVDHPVTYGAADFTDYYFEHKRPQWEAMEKAGVVVSEVGEAYGRLTGRPYGLIEPYRLEDAEVAIVILGATAGAVRVAVDEMRKKGVRAGMLKVRCFRPFPAEAIATALKGKRAVAMLERTAFFGGQGNPVFTEVATALYLKGERPHLVDYIFGIGGRDTVPEQICSVFEDLLRIVRSGEVGPTLRYLGLRE
ncbi:MAG: pyruvate ferredoxin oxidoreductase [Desulfobacterota bacterium]|nr:pyruvate ferredoxin oxidoreductase [Thermodesulfobacteriota bacterium]